MISTHRLIYVSLDEFIVNVLHARNQNAHSFVLTALFAIPNNRREMIGPENDLIYEEMSLIKVFVVSIDGTNISVLNS